jgi:Adenylate kinase
MHPRSTIDRRATEGFDDITPLPLSELLSDHLQSSTTALTTRQKMSRISVCPFSVAVFVTTAYLVTDRLRQEKQRKEAAATLPPCRIVFVLGNPGSGKGTTCQLLQDRLGWVHLSTGDLLRAERSKGGTLGNEINSYIDKGNLVPSEVTCRLLQQGMTEAYQRTGKTCFLIDGFPRSFSNATVWEETMAAHKVRAAR